MATIGVLWAGMVPPEALAQATPPGNAVIDQLTVSGRFGLARADKSIVMERLKLGTLSYDVSLPQQIRLEETVLRADLETAINKSLKNHKLLATDATTAPLNLILVIRPVQFVTKAHESTLATGELVVKAEASVPEAGISPELSLCLDYVSAGQFKALHRIRSGGGRRALGIFFGVLVAAANPYAINTFSTDQFVQANSQNSANNRFRSVAQNEGVAPAFDQASIDAYAASNVIQLVLADYIQHINTSEACRLPEPQGPASVAPPNQSGTQTPTPDAPQTPVKTPALPAPQTTPAPAPEPKP